MPQNSFFILGPLSSTEFKRVHLFTGSFKKKRKLRILNTKEFFVLFNAGKSKIPPKLFLSYKRYGKSFLSFDI